MASLRFVWMVFKMEFGVDFPLEMVNVLFYSEFEMDVLMKMVMSGLCREQTMLLMLQGIDCLLVQ